MKRIYILFTLIIFFLIKIEAQNNFQIYCSSSFVFSKTDKEIYLSNSGFSAGVSRIFPISDKSYSVNLGVDLGINSVAFFSTLNTSLEKSFNFNKYNNVFISIGTCQGLELLKPNLLYIFDFYSRTEYAHDIFTDKKIGVFLELNYYNIPNYKFYSTINQFWGVNFGITYRFD